MAVQFGVILSENFITSLEKVTKLVKVPLKGHSVVEMC